MMMNLNSIVKVIKADEVLKDAFIKVLKDGYIEVTLYDDKAKRHTYIFKLKDDEDGRKFFTCFNRDFYI